MFYDEDTIEEEYNDQVEHPQLRMMDETLASLNHGITYEHISLNEIL